jgi:hypothetical protein
MKLRVWKIGTESCPATRPELKSFAKMLKKVHKGKGKICDIVWHHAVDCMQVVIEEGKDVVRPHKEV